MKRKSSRPPRVTVDDLAFFIVVWHTVSKANKRGEFPSLRMAAKEACELSNLPPEGNPSRRVQNVERRLGTQYFKRRRGKDQWEVDQDHEGTVRRIGKLIQTLDRWGRAPGEGVRIRLGVGHSVSLSLAPRVVERVRSAHPAVDVECTVHDSDVLMRLLEERRLDAVMTVFPSDETPPTKALVKKVPLDPALIANVRHSVSKLYRSNRALTVAELLNRAEPQRGQTHTIYIMENAAIRSPQRLIHPEDPADIARYQPQANYAIINELVASGSDLGITLPQMLTQHQALRVQAIPIVMDNADKPVLGLVVERDDLQLDWAESQMPGYTKAIDALIQTAQEELNRIAGRLSVTSNDEHYACYIQLPNVGGLNWFYGAYSTYSRHGNSFAGDLEISQILLDTGWFELSNERRKSFCIRGDEEIVDAGCVLTAITGTVGDGLKSGEAKSTELFVASFVRKSNHAGGKSVGMWLGRDDDGSARGACGHIVVSSTNESQLTVAQLDKMVADWRRETALSR